MTGWETMGAITLSASFLLHILWHFGRGDFK